MFVAVVAGIVALGAVGVALSHRRTARRLGEAAWVGCAAAGGADGRLVRVAGLAEPLPAPGGPPRAPLTGTPAAWCTASVTEQQSYRDSDGTQRTRTRTIAEVRGGPFLVRDRTGVLLVDAGEQLSWHDLEPSVRHRQSELPPGLRAQELAEVNEQLESFGLSQRWAGMGARLLTSGGGPYDLTEHVVPAGTPVVVLGTVTVRPDGAPVLTGEVLASTESVDEVAADSDARERRAVIVAGVAFAVALGALLVGALM